jgi:hypothetical protein
LPKTSGIRPSSTRDWLFYVVSNPSHFIGISYHPNVDSFEVYEGKRTLQLKRSSVTAKGRLAREGGADIEIANQASNRTLTIIGSNYSTHVWVDGSVIQRVNLLEKGLATHIIGDTFTISGGLSNIAP